MSNARITIVIPTLNRLELAKRALVSALAQTASVEVIVSDNGSTDDTDNYFRELTLPKNVRYYHFDQTISVQDHGAFLRGKVLTDWVVFLSDDDVLEPTFAEQCLLLIDERPQLSIVYTGAYLIYDGLVRPGRFGPRTESSANFFLNFLRGERNICMCATVFRISEMRAIPPQPRNRLIGDMYYWVRILYRAGEIGCVGQNLSNYYFYRPQITSETRRINIKQWHEETEELARLMAEAIILDPAGAGDVEVIRTTAKRYVSMSTILQVVWSGLNRSPRASLLSALLQLAPNLCSDVKCTVTFLVCGTAVSVLPHKLLQRAMLWEIRRRMRIDAAK